MNNSLLQHVLATGQGLPITLAVLHMALGLSIGLPIMPINMPKHFLLRMGEPGSEDETFIDAFHEGRLMSRCVTFSPLSLVISLVLCRPHCS